MSWKQRTSSNPSTNTPLNRFTVCHLIWILADFSSCNCCGWLELDVGCVALCLSRRYSTWKWKRFINNTQRSFSSVRHAYGVYRIFKMLSFWCPFPCPVICDYPMKITVLSQKYVSPRDESSLCSPLYPWRCPTIAKLCPVVICPKFLWCPFVRNKLRKSELVCHFLSNLCLKNWEMQHRFRESSITKILTLAIHAQHN